MKNEALVGIDIDYLYLMEDFVFRQHQEDFYLTVLDKSSQSVIYHPRIREKSESQFSQGITLATIEGNNIKKNHNTVASQPNLLIVIHARWVGCPQCVCIRDDDTTLHWKKVVKEYFLPW